MHILYDRLIRRSMEGGSGGGSYAVIVELDDNFQGGRMVRAERDRCVRVVGFVSDVGWKGEWRYGRVTAVGRYRGVFQAFGVLS